MNPFRPMVLLLPFALVFVGCNALLGPDERVQLDFDLRTDDQGWVTGFADYPVGEDEQLQLEAGRRPLPEELEQTGEALYIAGMNNPDDLFMFLKRRVTELEPDAEYRASYEIVIASDGGTDCPGIGGAPGESVYMKAGGAPIEPVPVIEDASGTEMWRMNVDKGHQAAGGEHARIIGDAANGSTQCLDTPYRLKTLRGNDIPITSAADGSLWLLIGSDSGFEGYTGLYYLEIHVTLER
jgi:hypothetical protein